MESVGFAGFAVVEAESSSVPLFEGVGKGEELVGTDEGLGHVEIVEEGGFESGGREVGQTADETVGGKDEQAGVLHGDQNEHAVVGRVIGGEGAAVLGFEFFLVLEGGGVAVMAVGDVDGFVFEEVDDGVFDVGVDDGPEVVLDAVEGGGEVGFGEVFEEEAGDFVARVGEEAEDGGELEAGGAHEFEAVFDGGVVSFFVGDDFAGAEGGEADEADHAVTVDGARAVLKGLGVGVGGGAAIAGEGALGEPALESLVGFFVGGVWSYGFWREVGEIDGDDVVGVFGLQGGFAGFVQDIIGRGDEVADVREELFVEMDTDKRADVSHGLAGYGGAGLKIKKLDGG